MEATSPLALALAAVLGPKPEYRAHAERTNACFRWPPAREERDGPHR